MTLYTRFEARSGKLNQRRDELNRMISGLDFGKDKYQFKITRNTGADGKYYPMFMDDSLNIDPSVLNTTMDDQMNLFSMEHENKIRGTDE